jgi:hypothetical protein
VSAPAPYRSPAADGFASAVRRLEGQVGHWTSARWAARSAAERVHALVQRLADLTAEAEGEPARSVPRLVHDTALPDQLVVVAGDLLATQADDTVLERAAEAVRTTSASLD